MKKTTETRGRKSDAFSTMLFDALKLLKPKEKLSFLLKTEKERQQAYHQAEKLGIEIKTSRPKGQLEVERVK